MTVKNKDFIKLFEKFDKYFEEDKTIQVENIELTRENENFNNCIYFYNEDKSVKYELYSSILEDLEIDYSLFYTNEENNLLFYSFQNLEEEIKNLEVLNAYNILSNLKIIKIENF